MIYLTVLCDYDMNSNTVEGFLCKSPSFKGKQKNFLSRLLKCEEEKTQTRNPTECQKRENQIWYVSTINVERGQANSSDDGTDNQESKLNYISALLK